MSLDPPNFTQQVAVVTGASGGIGGAIATALVQLGATVYAVGRDQDRLEALATRLSSALGTVRLQRADLKRDDEVSALVAEVERSAGRLDILVHSAGSIAYGKLEETPVQTLDDLYTGNVRAPYLLTQKLLGMLQSAAGQIVLHQFERWPCCVGHARAVRRHAARFESTCGRLAGGGQCGRRPGAERLSWSHSHGSNARALFDGGPRLSARVVTATRGRCERCHIFTCSAEDR